MKRKQEFALFDDVSQKQLIGMKHSFTNLWDFSLSFNLCEWNGRRNEYNDFFFVFVWIN